MANSSSFGGTVKLSGESEYIKALKNISSNLKVVSSELKLTTTEFVNNGQKVGDLRAKNEVLNQKLKEEQSIIKTCTNAIKDFTDQQTKNKNEIDKLRSSLDSEKQALDKMKNSTTATSSEITKQEKLVADLSKELTKAETTYDANNRKINDYKFKMSEAQSSCSNLSKEINDNNSILSKAKDNMKDNAKSIKDFSTEEDNAGQSTLKLGDLIKANLISEGIVAGIKGLASKIKELGKAMIDVGKQSLNSFADYEQLIGGVETLFKDSAGVVENYANNAYKTAGLSANEYMETVTSFSASLLKSLNNDTGKSAEYANGAIIDMADNANKMGTSMDMIQNAYQGFAKQNYTMLDNLKLGYGGTKTEMERLISDANKVKKANGEMANLSISSFADVTEAIHIIQTEMGITGTTAKEASTTILGSVSSMKSSWQNLLKGLVDVNGEIDILFDNFVNSVVTAANNILPTVYTIVETMVACLPDLINKMTAQLPDVMSVGRDIIEVLVVGIKEAMPTLVPMTFEIINTLVTTLINLLPQILQMGIQLIVSLVQGIAQQLPTLIPQMINAVTSMVETLLDNIDLLVNAGIQLIIGLADGLINALPSLIDKIPVIIDKLINAIVNNLPKLIEAGITLTIKLTEGLIKAIPQLVAQIPKIISSLVSGLANGLGNMFNVGKQLLGRVKDGLKNGISGMADIGKNVVQGLWNGINNATDWVLNKIKGFGKSVLKGIKKIFGIKSPSTVFRDEIGVNLAKGIGVGFENEMRDVNNTIQNALPTDLDVKSKINLSSNSSLAKDKVKNNTPSKVENNTYNFYSPKDSPVEYARNMRKERMYLEMVGA